MEKVRRNEFREDLYYRLKVVEIRIPRLREHREDIPLLIRHFLAVFSRELNKEIRDVSPEVLRIMMSHDWPGNIRELKNILEHVSILCEQDTITEEDLPVDFPAGKALSPERKAPPSLPPQPCRHSGGAGKGSVEQNPGHPYPGHQPAYPLPQAQGIPDQIARCAREACLSPWHPAPLLFYTKHA